MTFVRPPGYSHKIYSKLFYGVIAIEMPFVHTVILN